MPLYEYECQACHRRTEKIQKFSDPELTVCPFCQGPLERTLTAPAVHFAGGGWYKDGYASAKPSAAGEGKADQSDQSNKSNKPGESAPSGDKSASSSGADSSAAPSTPSAPSTPAPAAATPAKSNS